MRSIPYVREEEAQIARDLEQRLLATKGAGILFVGVTIKVIIPLRTFYDLGSAQGTESEGMRQVHYQVYLGIDRSFEEETLQLLATQLITKWYPAGLAVTLEAHRGCIAAAAVPT